MPRIMRMPQVIGIVALAVMATVVVEEYRIAEIRERLPKAEPAVEAALTPSSQPSAVAAGTDAPVKTKSSEELRPEPPVKEAAVLEESIVGTARKMWENAAGKSMMSQQAKMAVALMYQNFIDGLKLSSKEADYFRDLLGRAVTDQQELGMKMLGATDEERETLEAELKEREAKTQEEIRKFLNNEEDFKAYNAYKERLPEYQQLDGVRTAMTEAGAPLEPETEKKLVEAMFRARVAAKGPDLNGPAAMEELAKGNVTETFDKSWNAQQEALRAETAGLLTPAQAEAFMEYQKQAKEMQLMGLKMAEKMMEPKEEKND